MQAKSFLVSSLLVVSLAACGKSSSSSSASDPTPSAKPVEAAKLEFKKVGGLGLEVEVSAEATIDDKSAGAGFPTATIWATPTTFVSGAGEMSDLKPTLEETTARLVKEEKSLQPSRSDKTADGWIIEMTGTSMGDPMTAVSVRRTIGGKPFDCGSNVKDKAEAAAVVKLCQSLRAAK
ncbi:MAG: hypothetical protein NT062_10370 [Proteobacteria bacterium]|nr:hypothetical protein [Pseudomonadota bacterium]